MLRVMLSPVWLGRRRRPPVETLVPWEPPKISESEVQVDEQTQDCSEEAPNRNRGYDLHDVRCDEGHQRKTPNNLTNP